MSEQQQTRSIRIRLQIILGLLGAIHGHLLAQGNSLEVPQNAHAKSHGNGWECNRGYQEVDEGCAAI